MPEILFTPLIGMIHDRGRNRLLFGSQRIAKSFQEQLSRPLFHAREKMGDVPVLIGEVGIAYDLDNKAAFTSGDFSAQEQAFNRTLEALEANLHHFTLWNYTADNTNARGDQWNDEDLSVFCKDQQTNPDDINSGGRALEAVLRPYPVATAGKPIELKFDYKTKVFTYRFQHHLEILEPTIIYIPTYQYPGGCQVEISDGKYEYSAEGQILKYWHVKDNLEHKILIRPSK